MTLVRSWCVVGLAAVALAGRSHAAVVGCTCSGQDKVVFDTNGNHLPDPGANSGNDPGDSDAYWTFAYDDEAHVFMIEGHGLLPQDFPNFHERILFSHVTDGATTTFEEILEHQSGETLFSDVNDCHRVNMVRAVLSTPPGGSGFNGLDVYWLRTNPGGDSVLNCIPGNENVLGGVEGYPALVWNANDLAFSGRLVDTDRDGVFDRRQGSFNLNTTVSPWVVDLLFDAPLEYHPGPDDRQYAVIPAAMVAYLMGEPWEEQPGGPFDMLIPMQDDKITLACGGSTLIEVVRAGAPPPGRRLRRFLPRGTGSISGGERGGQLLEASAAAASSPWEAGLFVVALVLFGGSLRHARQAEPPDPRRRGA